LIRDARSAELGTVWLPLPHLLMIPFLISDWMWHTGVGGLNSINAGVCAERGRRISADAELLGRSVTSEAYARLGAWTAALALR